MAISNSGSVGRGRDASDGRVLDPEEVKQLIDRFGASIDSRYDYTYGPQFPEGRKDVCAVNRMVEDGHSYGYNVIYIVWVDKDGGVHYEEIANTRATKDYMHIDSVEAEGDDVTVRFGSGGSFSGNPWKDYQPRNLKDLEESLKEEKRHE